MVVIGTSPSLPERFEVVRELGRGGMGVVYEVRDLRRGDHVALKTLREPSPESVFRLKREFRALADLRHPGLLRLHELFVEEASCFFTMDLVSGIDMLSYAARSRTPLCHEDTVEGVDAARDLVGTGEFGTPVADPALLRQLLGQLVDALDYLHGTGHVHRDLKPSNILVAPNGELTVLDFGLVKETGRMLESSIEGIVGTAGYMAPEQCREGQIDASADWYSVGCILYQALTGRLPFTGRYTQVLIDKLKVDPPPPQSLVPAADPGLSELAVRLLSRDPEARPGAAELRGLLGVARRPAVPQLESSSRPSAATAVVGRETELGTLVECLARVVDGERAAAAVVGESGMGKRSVVREFLRRARTLHEDVVVLQGRCFERETVSYQALDGIIDDLSSYWRSLPDVEAAALLPREATLLARLFPVLGRVRAIAASQPTRTVADPADLRSRGFAALRGVLQRIADRHPLVIVLDDMQWADATTMEVLADVLRPPEAPVAMLLLGSRPEARYAIAGWLSDSDVYTSAVDLGPLDEDVCEAFAAEHLGPGDLAAEAARESGGVPLFLQELVQHAATAAGPSIGAVSLDEMLRARIADLSPTARQVLDVLAVAGEPTSRAVLLAAGAPQQQLHRDLSSLAADRLIRAAGRRGTDAAELFHERVRDLVLEMLEPDHRRSLHRTLAVALVEAGEDGPAELARHWLGAGDPGRAAEQARLGAEQARDRLDFATASELLALAVEHGDWLPEQRRALLRELGEVQSRAGLSKQASAAFSEAAELDTGLEALDLRRRAAEELLRGGYLDDGLEAIKHVLAATGERLPKSPRRALMALVMRRGWLRLRGLGWRGPRPGADSPDALTRIDVFNTIGMAFAMIDTIRGADFQCQALLASLRSGDADRLARALAVESAYLSALGSARRSRLVGERARRLAREVGSKIAYAQVEWGVDAWYAFYIDNAWRAAVKHFEESERMFRTGIADGGWEIDTVRLYACFSRLHCGDLRLLGELIPTYVREAERRGALYWAVSLRTRLYIHWLVRDMPEEALADVEGAIASWSPWDEGYRAQHFFAVHAECEIALYRGDGPGAAEQFYQRLPGLRTALLLRVPFIDLEVRQLEGRVAAARAAQTPPAERGKDLRAVGRAARKLARHALPYGRAVAPLLAAAAAHLAGDGDAAVEHLRDGVRRLEELDTMLYANAARLRLSELLDGDEADEQRARAMRFFDEQQVVHPDRLVAMLVPGW